MKIRAGIPEERMPGFVWVYARDIEDNCPDEMINYGVLLRDRNDVPEFLKTKIAMIDIADASSEEEPAIELAGIGYRGAIWYVIYEDPKYAIEAGVDLSNLDNP